MRGRLHRRLRRVLAGRHDRGSVVVEFVVLGLLMCLPIFYLVVTLSRVQAGTFAVTSASREAGRAYVTADSQPAAPARAHESAGLAFADQGFAGRGHLEITCDKSPCLQPEGRVEVVASVDVPLPLVPDFLGDVVPTSINVFADHVETVDRFRAGS